MKIKNPTKVFLLLSSIAVLSGCGVKAQKPTDLKVSQYAIEEPKEAEIHEALVKAASSASESLRILASVNNAEKNKVLTHEQIKQARFNATYTPVGLDSKMTITNWNGPLTPIFKQLEVLSGYQFIQRTPEPSYGLFVTLNFRDETIMNVMRSIDAQLGDAIKMRILEDDKIVEIEYGN